MFVLSIISAHNHWLIFLYSAPKLFDFLVAIQTGIFSLITKNSFVIQLVGFMEIEIFYKVTVLFLKLKIIPSSCSVSLPRIKLYFNNVSDKLYFSLNFSLCDLLLEVLTLNLL